MVIDRNHLAAGLFTRIMPTATGLGQASPEERQQTYDQVSHLCFEMADAFIIASRKSTNGPS